MQTVLSQFCEELERRVRPVLEPLDRFASSLGQAQDGTPARGVLPQLLDLRHQLRALVEKVERQQAYVIIFGPLKSGKSTLMNAMSAAYVSEVTTLPAYPCMVYVSHAPERQFVLTRYDGTQETLGDVTTMRRLMRDAHVELAEAIRGCESRGEEFDPSVHLPRAVRRVDVHTPAEQLAGSGAVLVDTPGLYSRMKFGYDLMTRECRDAAASAVFVVKTDNLFLEQVFAEFSDLLRLFSRIFLVVNLDTTKQDLQPDGSLRPSLERNDPRQIVEAFERLAMNAALKEARDDGRLRIYPIDLLRAASERLREATGARAAATAAADERDARATAAPAAGTDSAASEQAAQAEPEAPSDQEAAPPAEASATEDFDRFLSDLTQYLNSTDYLVAFLGDSLRQARGLMGELRTLTAAEPVLELVRETDALEAEREQRTARAAAFTRLASFSWPDAFAPQRDDVERIAMERSGAVRAEAAEQADAALARWFESDDSFATLLRAGLSGVLARYRDQVAGIAHEVTRTVLGSDIAAAAAARERRDDLAATELDLTPAVRAALAALEPLPAAESPKLDVPAAVVQVKKTFWDRLLFRSQASVRRRVLGPDAAPEKPIPRRIKQKRLGAARVMLGEVLRARFARFAAETVKVSVSDAFAAAQGAAANAIRSEIGARRADNAAALARAQERLAALARPRADLDALSRAAGEGGASIEQLSERYGATSPSALLEPAEAAGA